MSSTISPPNSSDLIASIVEPEKGEFSDEFARYLLERQFPPAIQAHLKHLAKKQREGTLTTEEESEMDEYIRVADFVEALKAKALASLNS